MENAIGFAGLLRGVMPVEQSTDHYLREFSLSAGTAQMVWQRVQARVAGEKLTAQYADPRLPSEPSPSRARPIRSRCARIRYPRRCGLEEG